MEQDREAIAILDIHFQRTAARVRKLEQAVLNIDEKGERTLFDLMDDKMVALKVHVEQNI